MIREVTARNFLSFDVLKIEPRQTNVFVGPNMSGKTNLLSLLKFLTFALGTFGVNRTLLEFGGIGELAWKGSEKPEFDIGITAEVPDRNEVKTYDYQISVRGSFQSSQVLIEREELAVTSGGHHRLVFRVSSGKGEWLNEGKMEPLNLLQTDRSVFEVIGLPSFEGTAFKNYVAGWRYYRLVPTPFMRQMNISSKEQALREFGENFSSWFMALQAYPENYARIKQVASDVLPSISELFTQPLQTGFIAMGSRERDLLRGIGLAHMSDGQLAFLALLSLILAPNELGAPVYCLEEPENYLHPRMIQSLIEVLEQRREELDQSSAQIFATTHSPYLVDKIDIEDLIVASKITGRTKFERPSSNKKLRQMLSRREAGLGDLWYSGALGGV